MTDVSPVKAHADPQPPPVASYGDPAPPPYTNGSPALDGTLEEEESSTIKCICGFSDDDGNTVLCERCDTWQHIVCYYESAHNVPDIHECTDCHPRIVDKKRATEKQTIRRQFHSIGERKGRPKTATKNHKKRVKDPLGSVQPNGWAIHSNSDLHYNTERKSASPRDQPPPSKRPKTNHRTSASTSILSEAPALHPSSRKRAGSIMQNGHSPAKSPTSPDDPNERFSPDFMNLYRQGDPPSIDFNVYTDIGVANDLSLWCNDREALADATGGLQPGQVFQRTDQSIEHLDSLAPPLVKQTDELPTITAHGLHPQWQYLTIEGAFDRPIPPGSYIGEVKGRIGRKNDYFTDPSNRWELLRHPEPFVFFPPHLPIYVDTRHEGTLLRFVRRSCDPNVQMKIITHGIESGYHFCLVATKEIVPGEELTIGWEIDSQIRQRLDDSLHSGDIQKEGLKKIQPWVACLLANFGGCACDTSRGRVCLLEHVRRPCNSHAEPTPSAKTKGRKTKKAHTSPLGTGHATNSRAGSEGQHRNGADDDHNVDARSTSGSHKSTSRDITPATHFSVDGGDLKMSDRERRKIQQQERLFEQLEYDEQHKGKRGKRNSAGSNLNTPNFPSSKPLVQSEHSPSERNTREHSHGVARKPSGVSRTNGRSVQKPKPVYRDSATQTDNDLPNKPAIPLSVIKSRVIKRPISFKRKLLQQAIEDRMQRERNRSASVKAEARSPALNDVASNNPSPAPPLVFREDGPTMTLTAGPEPMDISIATETVVEKEPDPVPPVIADVEMKDADAPMSVDSPAPIVEKEVPDLEPSSSTAPPPLQPPPLQPPSSSSDPISASVPAASTVVDGPSSKPIDLRLLPPPPPVQTITPGSSASAVTPAPVAGVLSAQSPLAIPTTLSPFSPGNITPIPGPARKKLSLSDYTSRRAKLQQSQSSVSNGTPPLMPTHATSSPTLSTTSLPAQASPPVVQTPESMVLPTVTEETATTGA